MIFRCLPTRPFQTTRKVALILPWLLTAACSDATHDSTKTTPADTTPSTPTANAYSALVRGDYAALPAIIAALDDAVASNPNDESSVFYAGVMRLWRTTQRNDDPSYTDAEFGADTTKAFADLEEAKKLNPNDPHAAGFYGIATVDAGKLISNQQTIDLGAQDLEDAVPLYPAYIHGIQALAFGALAKDNASFPKGVEALAATVSACGYVPPDSGIVAVPYSTDMPADRVGTCSDAGVVAHVWEGFWLTYGDIMTKDGNASAARIAYGNAKSAPNYDKWTLSDVLEQRLADLDSRTALYADADTTNDPTTWMEEGHLCVGCHANKQ